MSSDSTVELIRLAMDASLMRQTAIARNIANSNSLDSETLEVNFEQQIQNGDEVTEAHPFYELSDHHSSIDEQMALNVQNMTH
jgi:flagellar basal-body rod protein FlgB